MNQILIILPIPAAGLSANARLHWRAKSKLAKAARANAEMLARAALGPRTPPRWEKVDVETVIYWPTAARHDKDNTRSRLKAAFDGFTDAGIWVDDSGIVNDPVRNEKDAKNPRVEVTVTNAATRGGKKEATRGKD